MQKKASTLSAAEMEDYALMDAMKEAETSLPQRGALFVEKPRACIENPVGRDLFTFT